METIARKRDGCRLSEEEIAAWVQSLTADAIPDYQSAALLMAIFLRGMDRDETDRKSTRLNSSHIQKSRMPSSA